MLEPSSGEYSYSTEDGSDESSDGSDSNGSTMSWDSSSSEEEGLANFELAKTQLCPRIIDCQRTENT